MKTVWIKINNNVNYENYTISIKIVQSKLFLLISINDKKKVLQRTKLFIILLIYKYIGMYSINI